MVGGVGLKNIKIRFLRENHARIEIRDLKTHWVFKEKTTCTVHEERVSLYWSHECGANNWPLNSYDITYSTMVASVTSYALPLAVVSVYGTG